MISVDATALIVLGLVFALVLALTNWFFEPLARAMESREGTIEGAEGAFAEAKRTIEQARNEVARAVQSARNEGYQKLDSARSEAQAAARKNLDASREDVQRQIAEARERLHAETDTAVKDLEKQAEALASSIASRILGRDVA